MEIQKAIFKNFNNLNQLKSDSNLSLLKDVKTHVKVVIGETELTIEDIQKFKQGSLFSLNKDASELFVDILVDNYKIATGEIVVVEGEAFVKIVDVVSGTNKKD